MPLRILAVVEEYEGLQRLIDVQITAAVEQAKGGGYGWLVLATIGIVAVGAWFLWRKR